jgi:hypothetical protein
VKHEHCTGNDGIVQVEPILDRLSIVYHEPNPEHVKGTCGLLLSDHILKDTPGLSVTKNPRYLVSCLLSLPFQDSEPKTTVCFEAGPRNPGQASYRLDYNPAKLSEAGFDDLTVFLSSIIDPHPIGFFRAGKVTRCDVAIDLPGHDVEDVIVRSSRLRKHGVYSNGHGYVQTAYVGAAKSRRIVAYAKPIEGSLATRLRLECRLKPQCLGKQVALLSNPFSGVGLIPANFSAAADIDIPPTFVADSIRIGGLQRALRALDPARRKVVRGAYRAAESLLPNLDAAWALWPMALIGLGLGQHLGAVPVFPVADAA